MHLPNRNRMQAESAAPSEVPPRESPVIIGQLYRLCEEELNTIVTYLHCGTALEKLMPAAATLCNSIATGEIEHYKALCRLLRDLGIPFRLQARIQTVPLTYSEDPHDATLEILDRLIEAETAATATYRRMATGAREYITRQLLTALSAEEEGHLKALEAMKLRMDRS